MAFAYAYGIPLPEVTDLTGDSRRYAYTLGMAGEVITNGHPSALGLNVSTIGDELRAGGYRTMFAGKWDLGMHRWPFTPTYRGYEHFVGFYDAAEDHWTHMVGRGLDLRNDTAPKRDAEGLYSTLLFTGAVTEFIWKWRLPDCPGTSNPHPYPHPHPHLRPYPHPPTHPGRRVGQCPSNVTRRTDYSLGVTFARQPAGQGGLDHCCAACGMLSECVAFVCSHGCRAADSICFLKNSTDHGHTKAGDVAVVMHGEAPTPPPSPNPAPPAPTPVPGGAEAPLFITLAYQAVHAPLQAPASYIARCPPTLRQPQRRILCGMMQAVDEGIRNVTETMAAAGRTNYTLIFTTDNGGTGASAGTNWPLRGEKATMFEGGTRGVGFVYGSGIPKSMAGRRLDALMHVTDFLPTIVAGIAGLNISSPHGAPPIDGVNAWPAITGAVTPLEHERREILVNLCPLFSVLEGAKIRPGWQQSAIIVEDMKLIWGLPGDRDSVNKCQSPGCKNGWTPPPAKGNDSWPASIKPEPEVYSPGVWLFNLTADPLEQNNLASRQPELVASLQSKIAEYNRTHVWQASSVNPAMDPRSNPNNFDGVWTPWIP